MARTGIEANPTDPYDIIPFFGIAGSIKNVGKGVLLKAEELTFSNTVKKHINDVILHDPYKGEMSRSFMKSSLTVQEIMRAKPPIPDPGGVPGGLRWDVPGVFRGTKGTWELVVDPNAKTIIHYNFKGGE